MGIRRKVKPQTHCEEVLVCFHYHVCTKTELPEYCYMLFYFILLLFCVVWMYFTPFCGNLLGNRKKLLAVPLVFILFLWWELFDSTYYSDQFWFVSFALCLWKLDFLCSNGWLTKFAQVTKHTSTKTGKHLKLMPQRIVSMFFLLPILKYQFIQAY